MWGYREATDPGISVFLVISIVLIVLVALVPSVDHRGQLPLDDLPQLCGVYVVVDRPPLDIGEPRRARLGMSRMKARSSSLSAMPISCATLGRSCVKSMMAKSALSRRA